MLTVFIDQILKENGLRIADLEAVAVSKGPGSYTGLRIGVSTAKGIAYGGSISLIGIETTLSMLYGLLNSTYPGSISSDETIFCPMLDARRMEVYYAFYNSAGTKLKDISAEIISENSFDKIPESQRIVFFGEGALKCKKVIKRSNIVFVDDFRISASHMQIPAIRALKERLFEDVAYFEPLYLKDFITSVPRKNILG